LKDNLDTIQAMKQSTDMMKKQFKNYDIDKIYDLQDEMSDMMLDAEGERIIFNFKKLMI
jgi:charged multivesicular body protein 5